MNFDSEQDGEVIENDAPDYALPAQRRGELLRIAKKRGAITVAEIALRFAVSVDTIRRDLDYLAERGLIRRTHGGAVPLDDVTVRDMPVTQRLNALAAEKGRIARKAATLDRRWGDIAGLWRIDYPRFHFRAWNPAGSHGGDE